MADLQEVRKKINEIDKEMAKLFEKRMELASLVAAYKKENALPIEDKVREKQVIENNLSFIEKDDLKDYYIDFINELMNISKKYQNKLLENMKVAYCCIDDAFSYQFTKSIFSNQKLLPFSSFEDAYNSVKKGYCDACVLPFIDSNLLVNKQVLKLLLSDTLYVNTFIDVKINYCLLANKGSKSYNIKTVASCPEVLLQCKNYIENNMFNTFQLSSIEDGCKDLYKSNNFSNAIIATEEFASLYNLEVIEKNIMEPFVKKYVIFSKTFNDKQNLSILFALKNEFKDLTLVNNIIDLYNLDTLKITILDNNCFILPINSGFKKLESFLNDLSNICDYVKVIGNFNSHNER